MMLQLERLRTMARAIRPDRQLRNLGWFGLAEAFVRVARLVTIVVLARTVLPHEVGVAALALMLFEAVRTIGSAGLGQMIVRAPSDKLKATCDAVFGAALIMSGIMLAALVGLAMLFAPASKGAWWGLVISLCAVFLVHPFGIVPQFLITRDERLKWIAGVSAAAVIVDCLATAALAFAGFGAWAIVAPKLIAAPVWIGGMILGAPRLPACACDRISLRDVWRYALPVMGTEGLAALRQNADKILVGTVLGPAALGLYTFAWNAGVGLSQTFTTALSATVFPHLAEAGNNRRQLVERFDRLVWRHGAFVAALIGLQAMAIPLYVPVLLGPSWEAVSPLAAMLCFAALSRPAYDIASQALRAAGKTQFEMVGSFLFTSLGLGCFALALVWGLANAVAVFALLTFVGQISLAVAARWALTTGHVPGEAPAMAAA